MFILFSDFPFFVSDLENIELISPSTTTPTSSPSSSSPPPPQKILRTVRSCLRSILRQTQRVSRLAPDDRAFFGVGDRNDENIERPI